MQVFRVHPQSTEVTDTTHWNVVDAATSFYEDGYWFSPKYKRKQWDGRRHLASKRTRSFPTGLLPRVISAYNKKGLDFEVQDYRPPAAMPYRPPVSASLRDYQEEAVRVGLEKKVGIFHMATNAGKSYVMAGLASSLVASHCLVFVHRLELLHQLSSDLSTWLEEPVGKIGDGEWTEERVTVAMVPTLATLLDKKEVRPGRSVYSWFGSWDVLMIDECHHEAARTWFQLANLCRDAIFRFGFSGTPIRTDNKDMLLTASTGETIYHVTNKFLIDRGYSVRPIVEFITVRAPILSPGETYAQSYASGIVRNKHRNLKGVDLAIKNSEQGLQVLLLVREIEHGENLMKLLGARALFVHGGLESKTRQQIVQKFKDGELRILVSSTILDESVNIPGIDVLIMMAAGKSPIGLLQRIGRGLRWKDSGVLQVFDFLDLMDADDRPRRKGRGSPRHGHLTRHALERYAYLKSQEGFDVSISEVKNSE